MRGWTRGALGVTALLALICGSSRTLVAQERGAVALGEAIEGLGVNTRVLMIGAHPDDEDTFLITWLQRGRHVETAYLSLTRGDGGQNLIGNELGEALGVIRTEELLAARRIDGARQYFTRAFDFGFSKDTIDTYKHWQRDSILGDVVRVVRAFRPHVIIAVFSGTPRDGHGHHQVSGLLARAAYDIAADTVRFPTATYGAPWTPLKFYRAARFNQLGGTLAMNVGEYSPLLGRSYGEIAGESRSQHKSQGFGALQRKGPIIDNVRREASRVNDATAPNAEKSLFDGIDTSWVRFRGAVASPRARAALDLLPSVLAAAQSAFDARAPHKERRPLGAVGELLSRVCVGPDASPCAQDFGRNDTERDLAASVVQARVRAQEALRLASGIAIEALAAREALTVGDTASVVVTIYNRGRDSVAVSKGSMFDPTTGRTVFTRPPLAPGEVQIDTVSVLIDSVTQPWWLARGRSGDMFRVRGAELTARPIGPSIFYVAALPPEPLATAVFLAPIVFRVADQIRGEVLRQFVGVPAVSVSLSARTMYVPANVDIDRMIEVRLSPGDDRPRDVNVSLTLPPGLRSDSTIRSTRLSGYGASRTIAFRVRGRVSPGDYSIGALAESGGRTFSTGFDVVDYEHIQAQRIYGPASMRVSAVDVRVPAALRVAYITGVGDNVAPALRQLGVPVTEIAAGDVARADLTPYSTVVVGPRAYEAHPELIATNPKLFDFARKGGALVVQYGQNEMTQPGAMPFPITLSRPADRVTEEDAAVTIDAPTARELLAPNRIAPSDFAGWVQERSLYMPRTFDPAYRSLMSMNDTGEPPNKSGVLIAPLGDGLYIYTSLSFFRQLPAGVPGGARLFVNLLSANLKSPAVTP